MASHIPTAKDQTRALLENLPDDVTWDDIVYELAARRSIELGLADADVKVVFAQRSRETLTYDARRCLPSEFPCATPPTSALFGHAQPQ